jgi:hypothetical protein
MAGSSNSGPVVPTVSGTLPAAGKQVFVDAQTHAITVSGLGGRPGEKIRVQIIPQTGGTSVDETDTMLGTTGSKTFPVVAGTYDVTVTAPTPGGTVYNFQDVVVS